MAEPLFPPRAWAPNAVSATAIAAGFFAMVLTANEQFHVAIWFLYGAILLDMVDGRVARLLNATSPFGQQLDSLADLFNFGAAPAFLVYEAGLKELGPVGLVAATFYLLAGAYRLARYNITADAHTKEKHVVGLPIPIAASHVMAAVVLRDTIDAGWIAAVVVAMALLMLSRWKLPTATGPNLVSILLLAALVNFLIVLIWPCWQTVVWWFGWLVFAVVLSGFRGRRKPAQQT